MDLHYLHSIRSHSHKLIVERAHRIFLDAADSFLAVKEDLRKLEFSYTSEKLSKAVILRVGATEKVFERK